MKNLIFLLVLCIVVISCKEKSETVAKEAIDKGVGVDGVKDDKTMEWTPLFDGNSFKGWHYYRGGAVSEPWKLEDGAMVFYPPKERDGESFNIVTNKSYTNFVLSLEWKISEGGNSGIFWGVFEDEKYGQPYETGPEIQVLDNERHPDAKNGPTRTAGALYDMVAPSSKSVKAAGEWNTCILTIDHKANKGNVVLNGVEIAKFPVNGMLWDKMVADSKFNGWEGFGRYRTGKIGLQDHGDVVAYRNIKIKEL